ncbi:MAG: hypothetical protein VX589_12925, partial [Myxococcota bacterium]|nr:hypothetical protein [Myxococcota bacterium]
MNRLLPMTAYLLVAMQAGCGASNDHDVIGEQAQSDVSTSMQQGNADPAEVHGERQTFVIKRLYFSREENGRSTGFDLDGYESRPA